MPGTPDPGGGQRARSCLGAWAGYAGARSRLSSLGDLILAGALVGMAINRQQGLHCAANTPGRCQTRGPGSRAGQGRSESERAREIGSWRDKIRVGGGARSLPGTAGHWMGRPLLRASVSPLVTRTHRTQVCRRCTQIHTHTHTTQDIHAHTHQVSRTFVHTPPKVSRCTQTHMYTHTQNPGHSCTHIHTPPPVSGTTPLSRGSLEAPCLRTQAAREVLGPRWTDSGPPETAGPGPGLRGSGIRGAPAL